jgi:hypothetical protein
MPGRNLTTHIWCERLRKLLSKESHNRASHFSGHWATRKIKTQSQRLIFAPLIRSPDIVPGFLQENQFVTHHESSTDSLTASHVIADSGFLRNAAFRRSSSVFCQSATGIASLSLAMLSHKSSTSRIRSGTESSSNVSSSAFMFVIIIAPYCHHMENAI